jgi:serine/threonine-protein kinase RsbW
MTETEPGMGEVLLRIPPKAEYLGFCRLVLAGLARGRALDEEALADLKLAVTEACSNAIRHAYGNGTEGQIEVRYSLGPEAVTIDVVDTGSGFAPANRQAPLPPQEELSEHGMGIAIIASLMDELEVTPGPGGRGSRFRFTKYLSAGELS